MRPLKSDYVIDPKCLPSRLPLWPTIVTGLLLDRLGASQVVWAVVCTLFALIWIVMITAVVKQKMKQVLFEGDQR